MKSCTLKSTELLEKREDQPDTNIESPETTNASRKQAEIEQDDSKFAAVVQNQEAEVQFLSH